MLRTEGINAHLLEKFTPNPGARPLLPELSPKAQVALMCRMLRREGWDDHIAGHITVRQPDGTVLTNPWELAWDELRASDIVTLDRHGKILDSDWNVTPALGLHLQLHELRPDANVVIHNHARWSGIWADLQQVPPVYDQSGAYCGVELPLYDDYTGTFEKERISLSAAEALGDAKWALLANHGSLVVGRDLRQAHHGSLVVGRDLRQAHLRVVTLEWRCRRAYEVKLAGGGRPLADEVVERLAMADTNGFPFLWEAMARRELRNDPSVLE